MLRKRHNSILKLTSLVCLVFILTGSISLSAKQEWKYSFESSLKLEDIIENYNNLKLADFRGTGLPQNVKNGFAGDLWLIKELSPSGDPAKINHLSMNFYGSVRIYLDNTVLAYAGFLNDSSESVSPVMKKNWNISLPEFKNDTKYLIIHYTDRQLDPYSNYLRYSTVTDRFKVSLVASDAVILISEDEEIFPIFSIVALLAIALIFFIFNLFNHRKSFLFFVLYLVGAIIYISSIAFPDSFYISGMDLSLKLSLIGITSVILMVLFLYQFIRSETFTKLIWIYIGASTAVILLEFIYPQFEYAPLITIFIFFVLAGQTSRQILVLYKRRPTGYTYILFSGLSFTGFWVLFQLNSMNIIFFNSTISSFVSIQILLLLVNAVAIAGYLAKVFSERSGYLEGQIEELKSQYEKAVQKEKDYKKKEIAQRLLEAENTRKENEVEEARQIQLSLIPRSFPELKNVDIDAYMKTSTEVGGNYFDFNLGEDDKTLTYILGDSNGRGIKSVIMTAATKSLFLTNGKWDELEDLIKEFDTTLSKLGSGILTMALTIGRIRGNLMEVISAGMPAILVFRAKSSEVEQIIFRTSPIGSVSENTFETKQFVFNKEDVILVMTEGFPKLENPDGEKLNYSRIMEILKSSAKSSVKEIADELTNNIRVWSNSKVPNDDVSFIVIKFK